MTEHADACEPQPEASTPRCSALQLEDALVVYDTENRDAWIKSTAFCSVDP